MVGYHVALSLQYRAEVFKPTTWRYLSSTAQKCSSSDGDRATWRPRFIDVLVSTRAVSERRARWLKQLLSRGQTHGTGCVRPWLRIRTTESLKDNVVMRIGLITKISHKTFQVNERSRVRAPPEADIFPTVNEVQLHTAFHYHPIIVLV